MKSLRWLIPALLVTALACAPESKAQKAQPRIISGSDVPITTYPFQVRVRIGTGGFVRRRRSVTPRTWSPPAHCVVTGRMQHTLRSAANVRVVYGAANQSDQASVGVGAY